MNRLLFIIGLILFIAIPPAFTQTYSSPNYTLSGANIAPGGGTAGSAHYSFHYCVIGSACGGRAASAHYHLQANRFADKAAPRLSISLNPANWAINTVAAGSSKIMGGNEKITVLNDGNIAETYSLQVIESTGTWRASAVAGDIGIDRYVMSGLFTGSDTPSVFTDDFNENGGEDVIREGEAKRSSHVMFATSSSSKNGASVKPREERALWLKFDAPEADTTGKEHELWVIVGAEVAE